MHRDTPATEGMGPSRFRSAFSPFVAAGLVTTEQILEYHFALAEKALQEGHKGRASFFLKVSHSIFDAAYSILAQANPDQTLLEGYSTKT